MMFTPRQYRIVHAALYELNAKLSRGLANSGLEQGTARLLRGDGAHIHESEVQALIDRVSE